MRVLWFSCTPSCYDVITVGGWVMALEKIVRKYLPEIELGIAFEHRDKKFKEVRDGVTYYPICEEWSLVDKVRNKFRSSARLRYERLRPRYLAALNDFKPDIVQCFGTELWHYSLLQKETDVPFIIHLMGLWNIHKSSGEIVSRKSFIQYCNPANWISWNKSRTNTEEHAEMEIDTMKCCRHYMGRTEWDKGIVRHFSPHSAYYYCPEAIRESIYDSPMRWQFRREGKIRLIGISNPSTLKGNEIMLRTAWLLKNRFGKEIEWKVTITKDDIRTFEKQTGIRCSDVGIVPMGRLSSSEIPKAICESEFFIHCSCIDNSPNAICEAQLLGIPVISTNAGGIPQIVTDNETGFLYPYAEPYALAFKIMELHNNEPLLTRISENEYRMAHERHNPQEIAKRVMEIYQQIINRK